MIQTPDGYIAVIHGKLTVNVPKNLFSGETMEPVEDKVIPFREMLKLRYPWLNDNSLDVLMRKARGDMLRLREEETNGLSKCRILIEEGRSEEAIKHLKRCIEAHPDDPDLWYALGELYCKSGYTDEGYKAFARGRELF